MNSYFTKNYVWVTSKHVGKKKLHDYWSVEKCMEKAVAIHSSTLAWEIPWTEEPGRLQSMGSRRVRHNWATSLSLFTVMRWRRKWQPTPVFLPGESQLRETDGLLSMGSHRVGHDWSDLAAAAATSYSKETLAILPLIFSSLCLVTPLYSHRPQTQILL